MHDLKLIKILFLGASKRVSLVECFFLAAKKLPGPIQLEIFSCEIKEDFYPISHLVKIIAGPKFLSDAFEPWLVKVQQKHQFDIIIPNLDPATIALSKIKEKKIIRDAVLLVSDFYNCEVMFNKLLANLFFEQHGIPVPPNKAYPKIVKPICGSAGKGHVIIPTETAMKAFLTSHKSSDYIMQELIVGKESTVDIYFNFSGKKTGFVIRDRLEVSDGEVMNCQTRHPEPDELGVINKVATTGGWFGCITLQYIRNKQGIYVIEINPRLGGGVTCAIESGLDVPYFILNELCYGISPEQNVKIKLIRMVRARRDFFKELPVV